MFFCSLEGYNFEKNHKIGVCVLNMLYICIKSLLCL